MFDLSAIVRPSIAKVSAYSSARDEFSGGDDSYIFLDANENPEKSIGTDIPYNRYPDPYQRAVKAKLGEVKGVHPKQIFIGNGSDESIDLLYRIFCQPGVDNVITLQPTYGMYKVSAAINDVLVQEVNLTKDYQLDIPAILDKVNDNTKMIFVCSPNNPTGATIKQEDIIQLLLSFKGLVIVDEAYVDFCPEKTCVPLLNDFPNLVITQTFSKAWGLANLRVGIAFASKEIIDIINKVKPPYNVNGYSQKIALQALENADEKTKIVNIILGNRLKLEQALKDVRIVEHIYPSESNQLLVRITDATAVYNKLVDQRIIVRNRANVVLCDSCLRFTIGTKDENSALVEALKQF